MIDLTSKDLPNTIMVDGKSFSIFTDFRIWIRFMNDIADLKRGEAFDCSYVFMNAMPRYINISELMPFASPKNELPRSMGHSDEIMLDFRLDSDLIYSAFMGQYGIDLIDVEHLHWHKFLALLNGINESTRLHQVMGYRAYDKNVKGDQYEKLKSAWRIERITEEEKEQAEKFESLFI